VSASNESEETTPTKNATRRTFLKRAGLGATLVGLGAVGAETVRAATTAPVPARTASTGADPLRIDNVSIVDPTDGSMRRDHSIVIRGGFIEALMLTSEAPVETSMRTIAGEGRFAVPGYNDMHTHVLQDPNPQLGFALMLAQGITGIRQMEGSSELLRNRAENRLGLNETTPRLLGLPGELLLPFNANTVDGVRDVIARQWDEGADFIKMVLTDREVFAAAIEAAHSQGLRIAGHMPPPVRIDDAVESGFDSFEHLGTGLSVFLTTSSEADALWAKQPTDLPFPSWAVRLPFAGAAFDTFLKGSFLGPATNSTNAEQLLTLKDAFASYSEDRAAELGRAFARKQAWNTPTLVGIRTKYRLDDPEFVNDPWLEKLPASQREAELAEIEKFSATPTADLDIFHEYYDRIVQTIGIWAKEGAPIMTGTDNNGKGAGTTLALEFRELGRAGLTPLEVLQATTTAPATYLDRTDRMGRVAAGMNADLLLLDEDPLASIDNLSSISMVVRDGHDYSSEQLDARVEELLAAQLEK
jgi:imidazolonepropionase-like amidohydrolase